MKTFLLLIIVVFTTCIRQRHDLDYPKKIEEIAEVTLIRPDKASNGKFATVKDLTKNGIKELVKALHNAKSVAVMELIPDYFIVFTTKDNKTKRLKINGDKIKDYDSEESYEIDQLNFLKEF